MGLLLHIPPSPPSCSTMTGDDVRAAGFGLPLITGGIIITQPRAVLAEPPGGAVKSEVRLLAEEDGAQRRDAPVQPDKGDQLKVAHFQG